MINDDTNSRLYQCSDTNPSSDRTSNPKPRETLSIFGDESCGEPLFAQHVVIDFTPNEEDNEQIQQKVLSFWKFINNTPEIQNLKVKPEKNLYTGDSMTEIVTESINPESQVTDVVKVAHRQAVDVLEFAKEKNLIDTTCRAKLPQRMCSLGSREYKHSEVSKPSKKKEKKHVCSNKKASTVSSDELSPVKILNRKMNEWDAKHLKSMEPPGHVPALHHCTIQRQIFPRNGYL